MNRLFIIATIAMVTTTSLLAMKQPSFFKFLPQSTPNSAEFDKAQQDATIFMAKIDNTSPTEAMINKIVSIDSYQRPAVLDMSAFYISNFEIVDPLERVDIVAALSTLAPERLLAFFEFAGCATKDKSGSAATYLITTLAAIFASGDDLSEVDLLSDFLSDCKDGYLLADVLRLIHLFPPIYRNEEFCFCLMYFCKNEEQRYRVWFMDMVMEAAPLDERFELYRLASRFIMDNDTAARHLIVSNIAEKLLKFPQEFRSTLCDVLAPLTTEVQTWTCVDQILQMLPVIPDSLRMEFIQYIIFLANYSPIKFEHLLNKNENQIEEGHWRSAFLLHAIKKVRDFKATLENAWIDMLKSPDSWETNSACSFIVANWQDLEISNELYERAYNILHPPVKKTNNFYFSGNTK